MNRTRLFYQEQYAAEMANTTVDMGRTSTTAASTHHYSDRSFPLRDRGSSSERRTSVGPNSLTYAVDSPRRYFINIKQIYASLN